MYKHYSIPILFSLVFILLIPGCSTGKSAEEASLQDSYYTEAMESDSIQDSGSFDMKYTPEPTQSIGTKDEKKKEAVYIGNINSKKFHYPYCKSVQQMKDSNKKFLNCTREEAIAQGYSPCGNCMP